jgi:hypothetical protein
VNKLVALVVLAAALASTRAIAAGPVDIFNGGDLHEGIGQADTKGLRPGVTYQASTFPVAVRVRPPDARWGGAQFQSGRFRFIQLNHLRTGSVPVHGVGYITLEAGTGQTGSVAQTLARLRATPHINEGASTPTKVAGFSGKAFDATIVGSDSPPACKYQQCPKGVSLVPFTTNLHCIFCNKTMHGEARDVKVALKDQLFRIIVISVRGKTVVIYVESTYHAQPKYLPKETFPTFLPYAQQMLVALRFPVR